MARRISFRNLQAFLTVARSPSISKAAEILNIAQPALSQQIRLLETRLGVQLLEHNARPFQLTEAGLVFQSEAERLLADFDNLVQNLQEIASGRYGWLSIGFTRSAMYSFLPPVIQEFSIANPAIELKLYEMHTEEQPSALHSGIIHIGLGRDPPELRQIRQEILLREDIFVAVSRRHALARGERVDIRDLASEAFILFPKDPQANFPARIASLCREANFVPKIVQQAHEIQSALGLVAAGLGISLVAGSVARHGSPDVRFLALDGLRPNTKTDLVAMMLERTKHPAAIQMMALMRRAGMAKADAAS